MAILMIDVDHFKRVNDDYGHVAGDGVLKEVAAVIRESTRAEDLVARYGGEEFVVALPVSSRNWQSNVPSESGETWLDGRSGLAPSRSTSPRASAWLSVLPVDRVMRRALIMRADQALYKAKAEGRNRVVFGHPDMLMANGKTESAEFLSAG